MWRIETTALRNGAGNFVLNGQKVFISAADASDRMMVVCRSTKRSEVEDRRAGMAIVVVDLDSPGIELQHLDIAVEIADQQFAVFFTDVEVPAANLIGEPDQAFRYMFDALNPSACSPPRGPSASATSRSTKPSRTRRNARRSGNPSGPTRRCNTRWHASRPGSTPRV
jgi:alkylation response protein AidB-like acyl-CoA dehydrogenase